MSNINPIKFGVTGNPYLKKEANEDLAKGAAQENKGAESTAKHLESSEVLGFMAAVNADLVPVKTQKTLDVSKYVTPEQEARIAGFIQGFEADYDEALAVTMEEFPEISENAAGDIALAYINASY